jgi:hypothetical protein
MSSKYIGIIVGIIGVMIAMVIFPLVMDSTHDIKTDAATDSLADVPVEGESADVVLTKDLFEDSTTYVTGITADGAEANPAADSYVAATKTLTITGLGADTPQDITVTYDYGALEAYTGLDSLTGIAPLLIFVGILAAAGAGIWGSFRSR